MPVSSIWPVFHACLPFLSSDLHPEAPGQDSILHRARDRWERSSLAVCPRGKTNTYLDISLLCPFFIPRSWPQPPSVMTETPLYPFVWSTAMFSLPSPEHRCFASIQIMLSHPEDPSDIGAHKFRQESSQGFTLIFILFFYMDKADLIRFQRALSKEESVGWPLTWGRDKGKSMRCVSKILLLAFKWTSIHVLHPSHVSWQSRGSATDGVHSSTGGSCNVVTEEPCAGVGRGVAWWSLIGDSPPGLQPGIAS